MKLALFFALVLISGSCAEFIINEFASRLKFPSCEPVTMRPTWLFERLVRQIPFPVASGTEVEVNCVDGDPVLTITCDAELYLSDGTQSKTITCMDEICPEFENCTVHGSADGYTYSPRTRRFYKYVQAGSKISYADASTTCANDNVNAVIAPPIEPDIIWLLNITSSTPDGGGFFDAMTATNDSPWLMSNGTEIETFYWCFKRPNYDNNKAGTFTGPWCIISHSCWFDRPCPWLSGGVICQLG